MTRMDWDRVHKEDLERRQRAKFGRVKKKRRFRVSTLKPKRKRKRTSVARTVDPARTPFKGPTMPGCTCGKPVGFTGLHKIACPIRGKKAANTAVVESSSAANFVLADFKSAVETTGHAVLLKRVVTDCAKKLSDVPGLTATQRKKAESAVRALLEQLDN